MQLRYPDRTIRLNGLNWRVRDSGGSGTVLLLLPGGLGNADIFYHQLLALPPAIRCITVDYPDADPEQLSDGLACLLDALGLERACLLGSSLAGYWLQVFGGRHGERVDALILANSFCQSDELREHPLFSVPMLEAAEPDKLKAAWLARLDEGEPTELKRAQQTLLREGQTGESLQRRLLAAATAPVAPKIPRGLFPMFLLDCTDDPILSEPTRAALVARYPEAIRLTLPAGGHYPSVTQADAYNRFVRSAVPDR